jgi:hypothetical protein
MAPPSPVRSVRPASPSVHHEIPRMQYRSRPVSVAVDPVSLVISECIAITSAIQKHARSPHFSVSAVLGGNPNTIQFGSPKPRERGVGGGPFRDGDRDEAASSRWSFQGQRAKGLQDSPMITGFSNLRHEITGVQSVYLVQLVTYCRLMLRRYSFIRCPDAACAVPLCDPGEGDRSTNYDIGSGRIKKVLGIWIYLSRIPALCVGYAVTLGGCYALSIRYKRFSAG